MALFHILIILPWSLCLTWCHPYKSPPNQPMAIFSSLPRWWSLNSSVCYISLYSWRTNSWDSLGPERREWDGKCRAFTNKTKNSFQIRNLYKRVTLSVGTSRDQGLHEIHPVRYSIMDNGSIFPYTRSVSSVVNASAFQS